MPGIAKREPAEGYPPEEGCYLRGNDYSPVAVAVILKWMREKTPPDIEHLVRTAVERGAALAGTIQTENVGLEKVVCNIVANPNIRYLVVCGPESPGHLVGDALRALVKNGVDGHKRIIGAKAPTPYLFNIPDSFVDRFRRQVSMVDLVDEGDSEEIGRAVWSCYQEQPVPFRDYRLYDPGAFPDPPLSGRITWRVTHPEREPKTEEERQRRGKLQELMDRVRKSVEKKSKNGGKEAVSRSSSPPVPAPVDPDRASAATVVLFACGHNAGRSQMAAAFFNALADPQKARAISAGTEPGDRVHPEVVDAMKEVGIDLSGAKPRRLTSELAREARILVTMGCGAACPHVPGLERMDWPLEDPRGQPPDRVREIRDAVRERVARLLSERGWSRIREGGSR